MKVMLDTNICIYIIKQKPRSVLERFAAFPVGDLGISVITLAELEYGASKSSEQTGIVKPWSNLFLPWRSLYLTGQPRVSMGKSGRFWKKEADRLAPWTC